MKVGVFLVGVPKAATTSLAAWFEQIDDCSVASSKEPNFFSYDFIVGDRSYYKGNSLISDMKKYDEQFSREGRIWIDASVSYSSYLECADRIKEYNPNAKIIIILRDPIQRAVSHYKMDRRAGYIKIGFGELFLDKGRKHPFAFKQVFENSLYFDLVSKYVGLFGRENVILIDMNDLVSNQFETLSSVANFIGIASGFDCQLPKINDEFKSEYELIESLVAMPTVRLWVKRFFPNWLYQKLRRLLNNGKAGQDGEVLTGDQVNMLKEYYRADVYSLLSFCGVGFEGY